MRSRNGSSRSIYAGVGLLAVVLVTVGLVAAEAGGADRRARGGLAGHGQARTDGASGARPRHADARKTSGGFRRRRRDASKRSSCGPARTVKADDVILELSNPQLEQQLQDAELKLQAAEAGLANPGCSCRTTCCSSAPSAASVEADYNKAKMQFADERGAGEGPAGVATRCSSSRRWTPSSSPCATRSRRISSTATPSR